VTSFASKVFFNLTFQSRRNWNRVPTRHTNDTEINISVHWQRTITVYHR